MAADLFFLPWLRRGFGTALPTTDPTSDRVQMHLTVTVTKPDTVTADVFVPVAGPEDIAGIDPRVVVHVVPGPDESNAEFGHFAAMDLDQADLPWRYTPKGQPPDDKLAPWIALVVLEASEFVRQDATADRKLPLITVGSVTSLPDLTESWAWAHVQTAGGTDSASLAAALTGKPGQVFARLICPRILQAQKSYSAFLVPTFNRGRLAGLGQDPPAGIPANTVAWGPGQTGIELPVYYEWRFQTGTVGSFDDLVTAVKPDKLDASIGRRKLDVSVPGFGLPPAAPPDAAGLRTLEVEGALQSIDAAGATRPAPDPTFVSSLETFIGNGTLNGQPVVTPPLYGQWYPTETTLGAASNPPWFLELDSDPRNRVGAALGTEVVQANQESLMAGAWEQVGNLRSINAERQVLQAGRETFLRAFARHFNLGRLETFFTQTATLHAQLPSAVSGQTIFAQLAGSRVGRHLFDPQWRRLSSPRGLIGRRLGLHVNPVTGQGPIERINAGTLEPAPEPPTPKGMATARDAWGDAVPGNLTPAELDALAARTSDQQLFWGILLFCTARKQLLGPASPGWSWAWLLRLMRFGIELIRLSGGRVPSDFRVALANGTLTSGMLTALAKSNFATPYDDVPAPPFPALPTTQTNDSVDATRFKAAMGAVLDVWRLPGLPRPNPPSLDLTALRALLATALDPKSTLVASLLKRLQLTSDVTSPADNLGPLIVGPELDQPMWAPLRDRSQEWIVPGLALVKPDTLGLLVPNQRFIEAYMVGLNHEMSREMLWNEYPSDQRWTTFRQFWDAKGYALAPNEQPNPEGFRDIKHIYKWSRAGHLGDNWARRVAPSQTLVLLLRAELIRRYPNVVVYAVQSSGTSYPTSPAQESFPIFSGQLGLDTTYYGFELSVTQVQNATQKWFFIMQEQPGEPRFQVPGDATPGQQDKFLKLSHWPAGMAPTTSAAVAARTFRTPTRVAVPARTLVPVS
jgi:hypothetical protein